MADVKDILGVPRTGPSKQEVKKEKEKVQRPAGMSREAFALLDASSPIVPSLVGDLRKKGDLQGLKEKRKASKGLVTWQWTPFTNQARKDGLQLSHWAKCLKDPAGNVRLANTGDYRFAKYNKRTMIHRYNEDEWQNIIAKDPDWSREETDYLLNLCQDFELRFLVIADRYQFQGKPHRSMEDLKARYYSVVRQLVIAREGNQEDIENQVIIKAPYDAQHEKQRKKALLAMMQRTQQQEEEENQVLEQAKVIEAARKAEEAQRRAAAPAKPSSPVTNAAVELPPLQEFTQTVPPGTPSLLGPDLQPLKPEKPGVYLRRAHTNAQAQAQLTLVSGGARGVKMLEGTLSDLNAVNVPTIASRAVCGTWLALRSEIMAMLELKRKLVSKQGTTTPASSNDGRFKKGSKTKAGKFDEDVEMPKEKRPRTAKKFADD